MDTYFKIAMVLLTFTGLAACNTTRGFGQDVEAAGSEIEETAEDVQDDLDDD